MTTASRTARGAPGARKRAGRGGAGLLLALLLAGAASAQVAPPLPPAADAAVARPLTLDHLDHLFAEAMLGGERVGVLNIYSVAPDYRFAIEPREGYACVDDAARAMVLLAALPGAADLPPGRMRQLDLLTRFVLRMQADNGYFFNFIWAAPAGGGEARINREYRTSLAELNWWSLRALWGLEAAVTRLPPGATADRARRAADRLVANLVRDLPAGLRATERVEGLATPVWLPFGSGADAASTAVLGLLAHHRRSGDAGTRALVERLGEGMVAMRAGGAGRFPYGAHLSWRNQWHAWGNAQAYALLRAGAALERADFTASALAEVDGFYPWLLRRGMLSGFSVQAEKGRLREADVRRFPQIAYGLSPMILASVEAARVTGRPGYGDTARRLAGWFDGDNAARRPVYDPATGRVLDGIDGPVKVSLDSGAESTVEGLLALAVLDGARLP